MKRKLDINNKIKGDLGELLFKHVCNKFDYWYVKTEQIYKNLAPEGNLEFSKGLERKLVHIPEQHQEELRFVSSIDNPRTNFKTYIYDYLTYKQTSEYSHDSKKFEDKDNFYWVEIKFGNGQLRKNQKELIDKLELPVMVYNFKCDLPDKFTFEKVDV
tara:strand:- start:101 stop:574 length:474 start_codon:yes stop_codon:yes gene_type:complete